MRPKGPHQRAMERIYLAVTFFYAALVGLLMWWGLKAIGA